MPKVRGCYQAALVSISFATSTRWYRRRNEMQLHWRTLTAATQDFLTQISRAERNDTYDFTPFVASCMHVSIKEIAAAVHVLAPCFTSFRFQEMMFVFASCVSAYARNAMPMKYDNLSLPPPFVSAAEAEEW